MPTNEPPSDCAGELYAAITACEDEGIDPYPIMAETLREMGWTVRPPFPLREIEPDRWEITDRD